LQLFVPQQVAFSLRTVVMAEPLAHKTAASPLSHSFAV
jgi:hypothetical protein